MTKALLIDSETRTLTEVDYTGYRDIQTFVRGSFQIAARIGDNLLLVDDEFLLKPQEHWFLCEGNAQPLAGRGLVVGPDGWEGDKEVSLDVTLSIADLTPLIRWMTRDQVDSWGKANASEPASSITDGNTGETKVTGYYGPLIASVPRVPRP